MSTLRVLHEKSELGKTTVYPKEYAPHLLLPIPRDLNRKTLNVNVSEPPPFYGYDLWNAYELSWLNEKGKPFAARGEFIIPATSSHLIESKSFKLYLNSFNNERFADAAAVSQTMKRDLSKRVNESVTVNFILHETEIPVAYSPKGSLLDVLDIAIDTYSPDPNLLSTSQETVTETLYSHLLKSNCPVTGQPDWGSIEIHYTGPKIDHVQLLKYIISYRNHEEFHEACVERFFMDILRHCRPQELTVQARYTRRGGLDINPYRSTNPTFSVQNHRSFRQ
ncbi:NADPH-dependent 7-cyano-7-deazaguanine reductase QueF [Coxiella burnetii]|uniref:NADPH-dependent 7-cyano-7-deazaguanine reductase n=3 Tax=Coxiella burnetii TaxID=777 RepID=QUEF_COXBU|nr:NADPH-dependent 7-cyano-7-deazaguanine reductase QueF [Coxiella burnetii]NP_819201.1 queuosine biosynthesis protein [Coxiella burnetii RSA 493]A9NAF9.1 RecName: Full=NADPH-dependent 7-cyano-7-deazaguanine reductase; AltName: Full=7-cyano-7-carbaguanine reductase; AltName: Full=NADPH-dependent nitrile oxidoreductase; AltName: Full=PreQ(0) reductase [Coxiella burnetii RSA 331]B6J2N7.1 RecName: Full=NADPH-dependent 7-cyano-7-deazaguanine reductase; AltName: Full=7-cyano-7-carbaguanine reductase;